ncbi:hypothetical protein IAU60_002007 [Kwoniella sp. DSM 27419]
MKISNTAPLHLSNYEVLTHFLSIKEDNDVLSEHISMKQARDKAAAKAKYPLERDKERRDEPDDPSLLEPIDDEYAKVLDTAERRGLSDELVWVQGEVLKYLCEGYNATSRQTPEGVQRLADELQDHQLTKAEVLQITNLAPTQVVELYAIIEEPDSRFYPDASTKLEQVAAQVSATLLAAPGPELAEWTDTHTDGHGDGGEPGAGGYDHQYVQDEMEMAALGEQEYVFEQDKEGGVDDEKDESMD